MARAAGRDHGSVSLAGIGSVRRRTWEIVEVARPGDRVSLAFDVLIRALIALNVVVVVLETIPSLDAAAGPVFAVFDGISVGVFTVEYVLRIWSSVEEPRYRSPVLGRLRFAATPLLVVDLLAVLPFYLAFLPVDLRILRGVRLFRLFRILKLARYSRALRTFGRVARRKREELVATMALVTFLILVAGSLMYFVEHEAQPEVFSSIPAALWWAVVTLTTVGYGDMFPVTPAGRLLGGLISLSVLGLIALPTAILGAAFVEEMQQRRDRRRRAREGSTEPEPPEPDRESPRRCPHCGQVLDDA